MTSPCNISRSTIVSSRPYEALRRWLADCLGTDTTSVSRHTGCKSRARVALESNEGERKIQTASTMFSVCRSSLPKSIRAAPSGCNPKYLRPVSSAVQNTRFGGQRQAFSEACAVSTNHQLTFLCRPDLRMLSPDGQG